MRLDRPIGQTKIWVVFPDFFLKTVHVHKVFEGFHEESWSTEYNSKETSPVWGTILKNIKKNNKKGPIFLAPWPVKSDFPKMVHLKELWFLVLLSVHQDASFELSYSAIQMNKNVHFCKVFSVFLGPYGIPHAY